MFYIIITWLLLFLMESSTISNLKQHFHSEFNFNTPWRKINRSSDHTNFKNKNTTISPSSIKVLSGTFILIFITFTLSWYIYISSSSTFIAIVNVGEHTYSSIFTDFFNPLGTESEVLLAFGM